MKSKNEVERMVREAIDEKPALDLKNLPLQAAFWQVVIHPYEPPRTSRGGILLSQETQKAEEILTTVGMIVDIGPSAFQGKTNAGLDLSRFVNDPDAPGGARPARIGEYVSYQRYTGQKHVTKAGHVLITMNDSELLGAIKDPEAFRFYL